MKPPIDSNLISFITSIRQCIRQVKSILPDVQANKTVQHKYNNSINPHVQANVSPVFSTDSQLVEGFINGLPLKETQLTDSEDILKMEALEVVRQFNLNTALSNSAVRDQWLSYWDQAEEELKKANEFLKKFPNEHYFQRNMQFLK